MTGFKVFSGVFSLVVCMSVLMPPSIVAADDYDEFSSCVRSCQSMPREDRRIELVPCARECRQNFEAKIERRHAEEFYEKELELEKAMVTGAVRQWEVNGCGHVAELSLAGYSFEEKCQSETSILRRNYCDMFVRKASDMRQAFNAYLRACKAKQP